MRLPRISIVTPSYNQAPFLEQTLRSVLEQGYPDLEYMVLDGGSSDGSAEIIERHASRLAFSRSAKDSGQAAALREGLARATGEVVAWINSDDWYEPGALRLAGEAFALRPEVDIVHGDVCFTDVSGRPLYVGPQVLDLRILSYESPYIAQQAMFWRRSAYERVGGVDPSYQYAMDHDLVVRMLVSGSRVFRIRRVLGNMRMHEAAKTSSMKAIEIEELERTRARHGLARDPQPMRTLKRWGYRAMRFARDPRCISAAVLRRLRIRTGPAGQSVRGPALTPEGAGKPPAGARP
jgi:glycosyltransferase involved in cell wall biosynthesis